MYDACCVECMMFVQLRSLYFFTQSRHDSNGRWILQATQGQVNAVDCSRCYVLLELSLLSGIILKEEGIIFLDQQGN